MTQFLPMLHDKIATFSPIQLPSPMVTLPLDTTDWLRMGLPISENSWEWSDMYTRSAVRTFFPIQTSRTHVIWFICPITDPSPIERLGRNSSSNCKVKRNANL